MIPAVTRALQQIGLGPVYDALKALEAALARAGNGGGGNLVMHKNRYDLSVNSARVENAGAAVATMMTGTTLNNVGSFTGGGTGNKAILGFKGHSGLPLASIQTISWDWENVSLPESPQQAFLYPYLNLQVELAPGQLQIFVLDPNNQNPLNLGTLTSLGPNMWRFAHVATADTNFVQVLNAFNASVPANPPKPAHPQVSPPVPIAAGNNANWNQASFRWSDILASFPGATLIDAYMGDGGLPGPQLPPATFSTPTPALLLVSGDSGARTQRTVRIDSVLFNGAAA
jgi:hypothetical protein